MSGRRRREVARYELTVSGALGPVLRGAFAASSITTTEVTTLRLEESTGCDLADLIALLDEAGVHVEAIYRRPTRDLPPVTASLIPDDVPASSPV